MRYCVVKGTTTVVDGNNPTELMLQNALNAGFTESEVEILTEDEYKVRLEIMQKPPEPTLDNKNRADIDYLAIMMGVEL